jgi:hypothetical protein
VDVGIKPVDDAGMLSAEKYTKVSTSERLVVSQWGSQDDGTSSASASSVSWLLSLASESS